ncbi:hypothetical protein CEXT_675851 [Caerostris extrusa]|uniref:Uncharacterized protein n=1 Tax=Caerostris extrusa TaxID=172846 RepID=A0AAV4XDT5_CAEEX|nr:hypothetical protein CEXT_675851 [Caerostris extrusa]
MQCRVSLIDWIKLRRDMFSKMGNDRFCAVRDLCNVKIVVSFENATTRMHLVVGIESITQKIHFNKCKTMNLKDRYRPNPRHHDKIYSSATRTRGKRGAFVTARRFALSCARETT